MRIGIIGYGPYGKLLRRLIRRFADLYDMDVDVLVHELHIDADRHRFFELADLRECDAVIFAVDMESFESAVEDLLAVENLRGDIVLVNVCSDQTKSGASLASLAGNHPYICLHTPWGPEAYAHFNEVVSLLPATVITKLQLDAELADKLTAFVEQCGFRIRRGQAEEHDTKLVGRWMFVAHLICQLFEWMGLFDDDYSTAPLSIQKIIEGARMLRNDRQLFFDLWHRVPACRSTFTDFVSGTRALQEQKEVYTSGK